MTTAPQGGGGGASHDKNEANVGAYLLGALPELEQRAFERHVMGCSTCRDEVERLRPAADALPRSVTPLEPPESLRASLMGAVAAEAAPAPEALPRRAGLLERARRWTASLRGLRPAAAWASAALLLGAGVAVGLGAGQLLGEDGETRIAAEVDDQRLVQGSATLLMSDDEDRATLSVHGVPTLPDEESNQVYQAWIVRGDEVIPSSVFSVDSEGAGAATMTDGMEDADAIWVTREPAGGSGAPSERPVMSVELN